MTARSQVQRGQVGGEHRASRRQLLEATRSSAVLRAAGVQFEGDISYAGLNQLLLPLLGDLDVLAPVHRDALRSAAEARGNPLALVELPTALSAEQRATLAAVPIELPLSERF